MAQCMCHLAWLGKVTWYWTESFSTLDLFDTHMEEIYKHLAMALLVSLYINLGDAKFMIISQTEPNTSLVIRMSQNIFSR